jgi:hypothetical protein
VARTLRARVAERDNAGLAAARGRTAAAKRPVPPVPAGLGPAGSATWQHCWSTAPWLTPAHAQIVQRLAEAVEERAELRAAIATDGRLIEGRKGMMLNPLVAALRSVEIAISRLEHSIGLSINPSRAAMVVDECNIAAEAEPRLTYADLKGGQANAEG